MTPLRQIEFGTTFFTGVPRAAPDAPLPLVVAARCIRLCASERPRALILGYGLGTMGALLMRYRPETRLVGVEIRSDLFFEAAKHVPAGVDLRLGDAEAFLRSTRRRFDLVIDDCYVQTGDDAERVEALNRSAELVRRRLREGGFYVRNLLADDRAGLERQLVDVRGSFAALTLRRFVDWDNVLAIASDRPLSARERGRLRRA